MILKIIKKLATLAAIAVVVHLLALHIIIKAPQLHSMFIRKTVGSKVVKVLKVDSNGGGTGFYVKAPSGKTYILTNKHVCGLPPKEHPQVKKILGEMYGFFKAFLVKEHLVRVTYDYGARISRVIKLSKKHDMCLIEPVDKRIEGLSIYSGRMYPGMPIRLVGHPHLTPMQISKGEFLGYNQRYLRFMTQLELPPIRKVGWIDASTYPGNSGSPVVDMLGRVVGILFAGQAAHISLIVPKEFVIDFLKDM